MSALVPPLFPQTDPAKAIRTSRNFWRLFGTMESSGDIIENNVSSQAVVIGADSDLSAYELLYLDSDAPRSALTTSVSVKKPFLGRLDALNNEKYISGDPGRILISSINLLPPPNYRPEVSASATSQINTILPNMDLFFYFNKPDSVIAPRKDKVFQLDQFAAGLNAQGGWVLLPYYGRRTAQISLKSLGFAAQPATAANIYGINFSPVIADPTSTKASTGHQEILLGTIALGVPPVGQGLADEVTVTDQFYDYIGIEIEPAVYPDPESLPLRVTMSDI